jgi:hypothetical protein
LTWCYECGETYCGDCQDSTLKICEDCQEVFCFIDPTKECLKNHCCEGVYFE